MSLCFTLCFCQAGTVEGQLNYTRISLTKCSECQSYLPHFFAHRPPRARRQAPQHVHIQYSTGATRTVAYRLKPRDTEQKSSGFLEASRHGGRLCLPGPPGGLKKESSCSRRPTHAWKPCGQRPVSHPVKTPALDALTDSRPGHIVVDVAALFL